VMMPSSRRSLPAAHGARQIILPPSAKGAEPGHYARSTADAIPDGGGVLPGFDARLRLAGAGRQSRAAPRAHARARELSPTLPPILPVPEPHSGASSSQLHKNGACVAVFSFL